MSSTAFSRKRKYSSSDAWKPRARMLPRLYRTKFKRRSNRWSLAKSVNVRSDIHYFKRFAFKTNINPVPGDVAYGALSFALDQLPAWSEFAALFDQYRIEKIDLVFSARLDSSSFSANPSQSYSPRLFTLVDNDDTTVPTGADDLRQSARCQFALCKPDEFVKRSFVPKVLGAIYNSVTSTGYALSNSTWLDMASPSLPHYGMKFAVENLSQIAGQSIQVEVSYHLAFRDTR